MADALEVLLPDGFTLVLEWLAKGELREQIRALEAAAGRQPTEDASAEAPETATDDEAAAQPQTDASATTAFSDDLIRWAKLTPSLSNEDLSPYLHLAASFSSKPLLDEGLPVRLRDIAAKLLSSVRAQQKAVTADDLAGLTAADAEQMVQHLARAARDRPTEQQAAMLGLLRITKQHPNTVAAAIKLLRAIPAADLQPGAVLLFKPADVTVFGDVLRQWLDAAPNGMVKNTLVPLLAGGA